MPRKRMRLAEASEPLLFIAIPISLRRSPGGWREAGTAGPAGSSSQGGPEPSPLLRSVCGRRRRHFIIPHRGEKNGPPPIAVGLPLTRRLRHPPRQGGRDSSGLGMRGVCAPPSRGGSGEPAPGKLAGEVFTGGGRGMRQRLSHAGVG